MSVYMYVFMYVCGVSVKAQMAIFMSLEMSTIFGPWAIGHVTYANYETLFRWQRKGLYLSLS